jgi:hypothetical protein
VDPEIPVLLISAAGKPVWRWVEDGYRVIARRPRSEIWNESVEPELADEIEAFT